MVFVHLALLVAAVVASPYSPRATVSLLAAHMVCARLRAWRRPLDR